MIKRPYWYQTAVFYELYVRAFADSNADGHGDLRGALTRLDYLADLGVNCIWLLPTFPSPLVDDGYDIADYYGVHPTYGALDDFKALIDAAHARGLRVIADLVLNHTSDQHPWFQASRRRQDPYSDYYVWSDSNETYSDARIIFLDTEPSNWTWDEARGQYFWHRFYRQQPDLNFDNPAVQEEMFKIARFWMDLGLDGFRADAVPYLFEREGTNCENLPETHAYLRRLRAMMEAEYPHAILLCEANQWPEDVRPYFGGDLADPTAPGDAFHMGFHFPVMPRLYMALRRGDRSPVVEIMRLLPYAIALEAEKPWSEAFEAAFARAHPGEDLHDAYRPAWHGGTGWSSRNFASSVAGTVAAAEASFASAMPAPSSSSSGFGGGGSSGGGGGGGGGGGW